MTIDRSAWIGALTVAGLIGTASVAPAEVVLPRFENGIVGINGFWFGEECRSKDQRRVDRCDGFIQGIAAAMRARRFPHCQKTYDTARLREAVVPHLSRFDRRPAPFAVEAALNRAFPCRIPPKPAGAAPNKPQRDDSSGN